MIASAELRGKLWALAPALLMVVMVGGLLTMAAIAGRDPGFALEPDYYAKAVRWDEQQAQRAHNLALGWRLEAELGARAPGSGTTTLRVRLTDANGAAIRGARLELEAFANARAASRIRRRLHENPDGSYDAELPLDRDGLWELRFSAQQGRDLFTQQLRVDVARGDG